MMIFVDLPNIFEREIGVKRSYANEDSRGYGVNKTVIFS